MEAISALRIPFTPTPNPLISAPPHPTTALPLPIPRRRRRHLPKLTVLATKTNTTTAEAQPLIRSLQLAGLTGPALHRTITRRPDILSSPHIPPFLDFLAQHLHDLRPAKLERLLLSTAPHLLAALPTSAQLLLDHGFPRDKLAHLFNTVNARKVFCERSLKDLDEMVQFLLPYGWPDLILRRPIILNLDLHRQLIPRVEFLTDLAAGDTEATAVLICKLPALLSYTVDHFQSHLEFWHSLGLTREQVFKIALVYPNAFSVSRDRKLRPRTEFLAQCGLGEADDMFRFLIKAPLFLSLSSEENLSKKLALLMKLGYRHRTRELAMAVGAMTRTSSENMQAVIGLFFSYGLSVEDVLAMSKKHPQVLQYRRDSLEKKMEFLVDRMERDVGELLVFPAFLGYKLDDRIKRRYEARLKTKGKGMSLNKLLSVATQRFVLPDEEEEPGMNTVTTKL